MGNELTLFDICSGIGGFSLAFEQAGFRTVAFAEVDPDASSVLACHWPNVPNLGSVREIGAEFIERFGRPSLIAGGIPCQAISLLGKQLGVADPRWLWPEAIRLLGLIRPRFAVFENPPAILTHDDGRTWNTVASRMAEVGYDCFWEIICAAQFGAGHLRPRLCIVCADGDERGRPTRTGLCESESGRERLGGAEPQRPASSPNLRRASADAERQAGQVVTGGTGGTGGTGPEGFEHDATRRRISDLRNRASHPLWWHEAHTGIPMLASGLPNKLVEAACRCIGNSIVPQAWVPIARTIRQMIEREG